MNAKQLAHRIDVTRAGIARLEEKIRSLEEKILYRRRRLRELGKKRAEELNMTLDL